MMHWLIVSFTVWAETKLPECKALHHIAKHPQIESIMIGNDESGWWLVT